LEKRRREAYIIAWGVMEERIIFDCGDTLATCFHRPERRGTFRSAYIYH
jgi:hypothetical protein